MTKKIKSKVSRSTGVVVAGVLLVGACPGNNFTDVGTVDANGGGGAGGAGGATGAGRTGATGAGRGGVNATGKGGTADRGGTSAAGHAGAGEPQPPIGEDAGAGGALDSLICDACQLVAETPDIRGVWAASDAVYWIEYGGFDALGNYQDDGRLLSLPFGADVPTVVATGLQGPLQVRVTNAYAYLILERSSSLDGAFQLARVGLDGGGVELLQPLTEEIPVRGSSSASLSSQDWFRQYFAVSGGAVFWYNSNNTTIFRLAEDSADPPQPFQVLNELAALLADDSFLYLQDAHGISRLPVAGGTSAAPLWTSDHSEGFFSLSLVGNSFYALDAGQDSYVSRLPKAGGTFKRLASVFAFQGTRLSTDGSSYVGDFGVLPDPNARGTGAIVEGTIAEPGTIHALAMSPNHDVIGYIPWRAWDATPTTVYIGYHDELYQVARQF